jgi:hypothetical protein
MEETSHQHTLDNPVTGDRSDITKPHSSRLARADFFSEPSRLEVTPAPDSNDLPKQGAGSKSSTKGSRS